MISQRGLKIVTAPALEPILLDKAKSQLRITSSDEDTYIEGLIQAAREWCEGHQNRAFITQTWKLTLDAWPSDYIEIPLPPLQSVTHVKYTDSAGDQSTWASSNYIVDTQSEPGRIARAYAVSWPSTTLQPINGIEVQYIAGYGDSRDDVPPLVTQAMQLLLAHLYENREATDARVIREVPFGVKALLSSARRVPI